ncbi:MAG: hypothetical protein ACK5LS_13325 [Propioniciclava sp.]
MKLVDADKILVTTFGGESRTATAEWVIGLDDDRVGVWTPDLTAWQARLGDSAVVSVQAADDRGRAVLGEPVLEARAVLLTEGSEYDLIREQTWDRHPVGAWLSDVADARREFTGAASPEGAVLLHIVA